jgi:hypothetical protein
MWRSFAPHVEAHAATCLITQLSTEPFIVTGASIGGGSSAVPVRMQSGLPAYAKPARIQPGDVARERLAFALGYRLTLPVASVLVSRETAGLTPTLPPVVALSFEALSQPKVWGQLLPALTPEEERSLRPTLSAMHAFHAWIDDHDHFGGGNMQIERSTSGTIQISFFDYSFSLNHQWQPPAPPPDRASWKIPQHPYANPDRIVMEQLVDQIQGFTLAELEAIIGTLPADCLSSADGVALAGGLFERGKLLKTVLDLVGAP